MDRTIRRLDSLESSASSARVLNLLAPQRDPEAALDMKENPLFQSPLLNRAIIVKHRLRRNEFDDFIDPPTTATKIIVPIDLNDLRSGGYACFVGQRNYPQLAVEHFGEASGSGSRDQEILNCMDALPSLDPFLLRENLRLIGVKPSRFYFNVSEGDTRRMFEFARREIGALTDLTGGGSGNNNSSRLAEKLLSNSPDAEFEPLRLALNLSGTQYLEGLFGWRGFLYYKWISTELGGRLKDVLSELATTRPYNTGDVAAMAELGILRGRLQKRVAACKAAAQRYIEVYDLAFYSLTKENNPNRFREFLLAAPEMFIKLGENLGAIQHIVSFWRFRFPEGRKVFVDVRDLVDIFADFEGHIGALD